MILGDAEDTDGLVDRLGVSLGIALGTNDSEGTVDGSRVGTPDGLVLIDDSTVGNIVDDDGSKLIEGLRLCKSDGVAVGLFDKLGASDGVALGCFDALRMSDGATDGDSDSALEGFTLGIRDGGDD